MARKRRQTYSVSNLVLAGLVVLTIFVSLVGTALVQTVPDYEVQGVPVGSAHVSLNVAQSPAIPTAHVALYVLPRIG